MKKIINGNIKKGKIPEFWDGKTAERIIEILTNKFIKNRAIKSASFRRKFDLI